MSEIEKILELENRIIHLERQANGDPACTHPGCFGPKGCQSKSFDAVANTAQDYHIRTCIEHLGNRHSPAACPNYQKILEIMEFYYRYGKCLKSI